MTLTSLSYEKEQKELQKLQKKRRTLSIIVVAVVCLVLLGIFVFRSDSDSHDRVVHVHGSATERPAADQRAEDERLRQKAAAEAARRREEAAQARAAEERAREEELQQAIQDAFDELVWRFESQDHLSDPEHIERFVQKNYAALLRDRENIEADYLQFRSNKKLVAKLEAEAPHILERRTWKMLKALPLAERLAVKEPKRKPLTAEQVRAKILNRVRIKATDQIALAQQRQELTELFEAQLDALNLDEDERYRELQQFIDSLQVDESSDNSESGKYKQV